MSTRQTIYQEHTSPPLGMEDYNEDSYLEDIKEGPILFHALPGYDGLFFNYSTYVLFIAGNLEKSNEMLYIGSS